MSSTMENTLVTSEPIGMIDKEVHKELISLQNILASLNQRIGVIEYQKYEALKAIETANKKAGELMKIESDRLGVPENTDWHITKDGEVFLGKSPDFNQ